MWPAPTQEDWKKPCLIQFQRTWEDALAVSKETGKPILICVNMDGEIASEHYAGIRYREPEKAKLYEPYVCVIASVYRHTPRDHDHNGKRVLCPRFGSVTCGEHISIEPVLYEKYFEGKRIAPRHIMVELDGKETYDVYYAFDTDSVFQAIDDGIAKREIQPKPIVKGDKTLVERVASRDIKDRLAVEKAYLEGDATLRKNLLEAAKKHPDAAPEELLRLAIYGFDEKLAKVAREALAGSQSARAVDVINEALRVPLEKAEKGALIDALARLGKQDLGSEAARARTLAVVHRGLDGRSRAVDVEGWRSELSGASYPAPREYSAIAESLSSKDAAARKKPKDAETKLQIAEANLELARKPESRRALRAGPRSLKNYSKLLYIDARDAAMEAKQLGAQGWRVDAVLAIAANGLGEVEKAYEIAETAVKAMPDAVADRNAIAVLGLFAEGRQRAILDAIVKKTDWPGEWLTDVHAAYSVVAASPYATSAQTVQHYDFLQRLGASEKAARVLQKGIESFPGSAAMHDRFRTRILRERGLDALETTYERMLAKAKPGRTTTAQLGWFAGYASMVSAEFRRRNGESAEAREAYDRAIAHFERAVESDPSFKPSADHYIAMAFAGRARVLLVDKDYGRALDELLASLARKPEAAATQDGLNLSAIDTAKTLLARLQERGEDELQRRLQATLDSLDPALLELPAYERPAPGTDGRPSTGRRNRRGTRRR